MKSNKKFLIILAAVLLCALTAPAAYAASEEVGLTITFDGELIEFPDVKVQYINEDGSYSEAGDINGPGNVRAFIYYEKDDHTWYILREMTLVNGNNTFDFTSEEITGLVEIEIELGENMDVLDNIATIVFWDMPYSDQTVKLNPNGSTKIYLNELLAESIKQIQLINKCGNTGVVMGLSKGFHFDGNYYLRCLDSSRKVDMSIRPSINNLFEICYHEDNPIDDIFIMGPGGGIDYKYKDKEGKVVLEGRCGTSGNPLHFEGLDEGIYDMEFTYNNGDLVLTAEDMVFTNAEASDAEMPDNSNYNKELVVDIPPVFRGDAGGGFSEMMAGEEKTIILNVTDEKEIEEVLIEKDAISIFVKAGKELVINSPFATIAFDSEILKEIMKMNGNLSISAKDGYSFYSIEEHEQFMREYLGEDTIKHLRSIGNYEINVSCGDNNLLMGNSRPQIRLHIKDEYLSGVDIRKIGAYTDDPQVSELVYIGGRYDEEDGAIIFKLRNPAASSYFNIYENQVSFTDTENSWAKDYIEVMAAKNIINGVGNGLFKPKEKLTKAQYVKMIICATEEELAEYEGIFTDCSEKDWFTKYAEAAIRANIIDPPESGEFMPEEEISREDMAVIAVKAYESYYGKLPEITAYKTFDNEADIAKASLSYVKMACGLDIISGMPDGSFKPKDTLTREQAAKVIYKLIEAFHIS